MKHNYDLSLDICRECGLTGQQIAKSGMAHCDGKPDTTPSPPPPPPEKDEGAILERLFR